MLFSFLLHNRKFSCKIGLRLILHCDDDKDQFQFQVFLTYPTFQWLLRDIFPMNQVLFYFFLNQLLCYRKKDRDKSVAFRRLQCINLSENWVSFGYGILQFYKTIILNIQSDLIKWFSSTYYLKVWYHFFILF